MLLKASGYIFLVFFQVSFITILSQVAVFGFLFDKSTSPGDKMLLFWCILATTLEQMLREVVGGESVFSLHCARSMFRSAIFLDLIVRRACE